MIGSQAAIHFPIAHNQFTHHGFTLGEVARRQSDAAEAVLQGGPARLSWTT